MGIDCGSGFALTVSDIEGLVFESELGYASSKCCAHTHTHTQTSVRVQSGRQNLNEYYESEFYKN